MPDLVSVLLLVPDVPGGLPGLLQQPETHRPAKSLVVFVHGSGSSRTSPHNDYVARGLRAAGHATLLFDLLSEEEAEARANVFDIAMLARRVQAVLGCVHARPDLKDLPICLFGASTGAAAALVAAAQSPQRIACVVSRGGRPDLAEQALANLRCPVLLIVGTRDTEVMALNRAALSQMPFEPRRRSRLATVAGATHLFTEPGSLARVVTLAAQWCDATVLPPAPHRSGRNGCDKAF